MHIEELIRENTLKKRMNDARLNEVQQITMEIKSLDNKNQRTNEENKNLAITVFLNLFSLKDLKINVRDLKNSVMGSVLSSILTFKNSRTSKEQLGIVNQSMPNLIKLFTRLKMITKN